MSLLKAVEGLRRDWITSGGEHHWVTGGQDGLSLAATPVRSMDNLLWHPHAERGTTLASIFGTNVLTDTGGANLKLLLDALYAPDASEQQMELSEGYRGRPHIGAAAILSRNEETAPFLRELRDLLRRAKGSEEVRVFLAGSVFGGTGAAGFPTVARLLRSMAGASGGGSSVRVGGALMLPYFSFDPPEDDTANVARSEELLRQSQAALKYYDELFKAGGERVFDEMYMVGWDPPIRLGYFSPGSKSQANPPLLPELVAAMSALRFFGKETVPAAENGTPVYISARKTAGEFGWDDLPGVHDEGPRRGEHQREFGRLLRFAAVWRNTMAPELRARGMFEGKPVWYKRNELGKVKFDLRETKEALDRLNDIVERVLIWAGAIQMFAPPPTSGFKLWNVAPLVSFNAQRDPDDPGHEFVTVKGRLPEEAGADAYDRLIVERNPSREGEGPSNQAALYREIENEPPTGAHRGLGRIVAAVHRAARLPAAPGTPA
jgi:hypothetical protein